MRTSGGGSACTNSSFSAASCARGVCREACRLTELSAEREVTLTHPFRGRLRSQDGLELITHHMRHHLEQLRRVAQQ